MNILSKRVEELPREQLNALSAKLLAKRQDTAVTEQEAYDRAETVWGMIEKQAKAHPEQTAIIDGETEIDYARLTERANAIAGELLARGVGPGSLVGVCMRRTWELVAALVGVLRAGCTYVPLDPAYPRERVRYILEHARAMGAIVDHESMAVLCEGVPELVRLDEVGARTADGVAGPSARDLAYIIYTSGSTGRPKGVAVEHRSVVAMSRSMRNLLDDEELAGVLAAASVCFDPSVMEILGTLSLGGTVVLAENALKLLELPSANRVRTCIMVPSAMQALLATGRLPEGIRCLVFGGEVLKRSLVDQLHAQEPRPRVVNVYGPTESTVYSTATEVSAGAETITIGKPVSSARSYILNDSMQPVPVGVPGELYLAGDQLARGYLHDEALTKERFIAVDPTGPIPEERLYRTGDLCRWREDGEIEFLGRVDQQVKIRGFRVELEEIESTLESMDGVNGAAAAVVDGGRDQKVLVVYVVTRDAAVTREAARAYLAERLPKYMLPQVVMHLEALPRLPNGKLDRKQLPKPEVHCDHDGHADPAPHAGAGGLVHRLAGLSKDERHAALLSIIRGEISSLLRLRDPAQVPPDRSLDDLGLDSLSAVELSNRLAAITGRKLPASAVIERSTPAAVADHILDAMGSVTEHGSTKKARGGASDTLGRFQAQMQSSHPPFLAAKAPSWSATDKGTLVRELKRLVSRAGRDPYSKLLRTGSAHRGVVANADTEEEREAIVWTTNLYLGLNRDPEVIAEARSALERLGAGMGTSAAASGLTDLHLEFERAFAELVGKPAACLFPTGFTANVGVVASLLGENDVVVMDQLCHASIVDGARLSGATMRTFRHNDPSDLESVLASVASPYRTVLVVLESVYSMGEGAAPVSDIVLTAKKYDALVLVDEAHSFGFYGPRGAGLCASQGVADKVDFIMTTLSKSLGSLGGVVAAREEHIALLKSSARAYIFQAAVSPADIAAALAALRRLSADDALRERLWGTTAYMRKRFSEAGYDLGTGDGPIVTPHFADKDKLYAIVRGLYERGVHTSAVTYPIVESGRGRLRFICSASHTREDVDRTLEALIDAEREAEGERQALEDRASGESDGSSDAHPGRADVEAWAKAFSAYLKEALARGPGPTPELAVSVGLPEGGAPITIVIHARDVTLRDHETTDMPFCTLLPVDSRAVTSLCSSDVQGLLQGICKGACVLHGQVEPFLWLIARMVDWQRDASRGR
ncbi:amino acid adenylation domain-containing protein [Polyangium aurulentum]|uniref:amino acid adenylation domain-containing protein n=1 Tax=Polyangium aurulentum TaxID=2567896 RepID=UPI0010AECC62|nr:amino acid adenylation domain-containing protein [Polyangium aurulentum]UQA58426.1 amino acid adenylation domain-containing protein [Polyangium aurulentum]